MATRELTVKTQGNTDIVDITPQLLEVVHRSGVESGVVCLFVVGSTAGITTMEYEPGLIADMRRTFEQIAPENAVYAHEERWHDDNGHSHIRASLVGPSLSVPITHGKPDLGEWQQVVVIDFDTRPRDRTIIVKIVG
jgi:secondary thiamine-phosphate synthase enzyme